ncbi:hypothetical protein [Alicycliphilus denitrificans]|uniref:hypothetical protein n=1 Tax=Alicycliphilus denitrificans TaxID=179636 RepID=UPI00384EBCB2
MQAYNALALLKRCVEQAYHQKARELDASTSHLTVHVASDYQSMLIALEPHAWLPWSEEAPERVAGYLLRLVRSISPRSIATAKRGSKQDKPKGYVNAPIVRKQVSTARVLRGEKARAA